MSNTSPIRRARARRFSLAGLALAVLAVGANTPIALAQDTPAPHRTAAVAAVQAGYFAPLVSSETTWRYLADDTDPSPGENRHAWAQPDFDDSTWQTGKGGFGAKWDGTTESATFDTGMVAETVLPMRPDGGGDNVRTYFFRTTFEMTAEQLAADTEIRFDGFVDDAAIVFINGEEVHQGVRFISINATTDSTFLKPETLPACSGAECPSTRVASLWIEYQAAWLDHILASSPSKWNVVTFHQPVYSASRGRDEPHLRGPWVPVFQKHNIDLVQMGHDHVYARGYNNDNRTDIDGVTDGPVYIVQNSGGKDYDLESDERNVWTNNGATQVRKGEDFSSFAVVKVSKDQLHYTSYIAERRPSASTDVPVGEVWDEFVVTKHDDGRKFVTEAGAPIPEFEDPRTDEPAPPVVRRDGRVRAPKVNLRAGKRAAVRVRSNATGRVRVVVRVGGKRLVRTVRIQAGTPRVVRLGRVPARTRARMAVVRVVLAPADREAFSRGQALRVAQVRR